MTIRRRQRAAMSAPVLEIRVETVVVDRRSARTVTADQLRDRLVEAVTPQIDRATGRRRP